MADKRASEFVRSLHEQGYLTRTSKPIRVFNPVTKRWNFVSEDERGEGDAFVLGAGAFGAVIEFKNATTSFPLSEWRDNQREWAVRYCVPHDIPYYLMFSLGKNPPNAKTSPRRTWLVPREVFLEAEAKVRPYQDSIPYSAVRLDMREKGLDAITLFREYELVRQDGIWRIPDDHIFRRKHGTFTHSHDNKNLRR